VTSQKRYRNTYRFVNVISGSSKIQGSKPLLEAGRLPAMEEHIESDKCAKLAVTST
jgi:hypothetical protein